MAHLTPTTTKSLLRVFVKPHVCSTAISRCSPQPSFQQRAIAPCISTRRTIYAYAKAKPVKAPGSLPSSITQTLDERIGALKARLVGDDNKLREAESMRELLTHIDRTLYHLRKVGEGPDGVPVVKVVSRESLIRAEREKEAAAKKKDVSETAKQVELNWAISENDLKYRLKKIEEFLQEGRRVEVLIAPKRKGRRAEAAEVETLLERIKECVDGVEGAEEWKEQVGVPGKVVEMYFKGAEQKLGREQLREERTEKLKKKELEKAERTKKQEERLREKEEERKQGEQERARLLRQAEEGRQRQQATSAS